MQAPVIYDGPYSISNGKLVYGSDNKTCDYVLSNNKIQFFNDGIIHIIEMEKKTIL